jgi:urease accessory protein
VCQAIIVHPPGGIAGGDELDLECAVGKDAHALLTTPGAAKWYRSAGPWAKQKLSFTVDGILEWLPRETIVFSGALASLECTIELARGARYLGWELMCLGRAGSGERFTKGEIRLDTRISRDGKLVWLERGRLEAFGRLLHSPAGLNNRTVFGSFIAAGEVGKRLLEACRCQAGETLALTLLPELLIARYLGDSSEEAMRAFAALWAILRPAVAGRGAIAPRIWST